MPMRVTRKASVLKLIYDIGGEGTREQINVRIPGYWELSNDELEIEEGTLKPLYWHHVASICQSLKDRDQYLENPKRGVWKITEAGREELSHLGLIDKSLPVAASLQDQGISISAERAKEANSDVVRYRGRQARINKGIAQSIADRMKDISEYIRGRVTFSPERVCFFIIFCQLLELHQEAVDLYHRMPKDEVDKEWLARIERLVRVSKQHIQQ